MDYKIFNFKEYCKNRCQNEKNYKKFEKMNIFFEKIYEEKNQEMVFRILRS